MKKEPISAFLCGAMIGAAAALLFAPQKGKTTRRQIKNMIHDKQGKLMEVVEGIRAKLEGKAKAIENQVDQAVDQVSQ